MRYLTLTTCNLQLSSLAFWLKDLPNRISVISRSVAAMFLWALALVGHFFPTHGFSCDSTEEEALIQKLPGLEIQHQSFLSLEDATKAGADFVSAADSATSKPLMRAVETRFLDKILSQADAYLEFGIGNSTVFALDHPNLGCVKGIESSKEWFEMVKKDPKISAAMASGRLEMLHVDIGPTKNVGYPTENSDRAKWKDYSSQTFSSCGQAAQHRVVLVDGRFRAACALKMLKSMTPEDLKRTQILIHDYNRRNYHVIETFAELVERHDRLALFHGKKPDVSEVHLQSMISHFENQPK